MKGLMRGRRHRGPVGPRWPEHAGGPRALIVEEDGAIAWADEQVLRRAGHEVARCQGPGGNSAVFPYGRCGLLEEGRCPLAEGADAIVFGLSVRAGRSRQILEAYRVRYPSKPIVIERPWTDRASPDPLLDSCESIAFPATEADLVRTIERALARMAPGDVPPTR